MPTLTQEKTFQNEILAALEAQGWLIGRSEAYDRKRALYPEDLLAYVAAVNQKAWAKQEGTYKDRAGESLLDRVAQVNESEGSLFALREGVSDRGAHFDLCQFRPDHEMNATAWAHYKEVRLRVVPELAYSESNGNRLDLAFFVNGIPVATAELKTDFTQTLEDAVKQYKTDRLPVDPKTRKPEPILQFKRGAVVHFAVSTQAIAMTTRLEGASTRFLPFNKGKGLGAGNPANPKGYATSYLWEEVLLKDSLLEILGRFVHLEKKTKRRPDGVIETREALIFPRYHQWQVVRRLLSCALAEGAGQKYLIQHSAGSGKSNSIAWLAHQLVCLHREGKTRLFDKVIVVTDRTVLDQQLQETIAQFERTRGVVQVIKREEGGSESKSDKLAEALSGLAGIIVVTLQTFPFVLDEIRKNGGLASKSFAVIADEAHSSQSGATAQKLREVLTAEEMKELEEGGELDSTQILAATLKARQQPGNVSFFAFTATPKAKTLEIFGRRPDMSQPASKDNLPQPFHLYSMKQAIEEGFILDVLKNYITYKTAYRLGGEIDKLKAKAVDKRKGAKELRKWVRLHPHNIAQRVQVIVEHFRENVAPLLNGQAKAMLVTSGRPDAVRYKKAFDKYLSEQGYADLRALVAFSGEVVDKEFAETPFTEANMNPGLRGMDLREAFDSSEYHVMIVANKFQTGFDQPKLCAMYVDKKLSGVDCVQTLSRLNRTFPGKDCTFVLDFANDPEDIQAAFAPYYGQTELKDVSDPNAVYDLETKLYKAGIFERREVEAYAEAFFERKSTQALLSSLLQPAVDRFTGRWKENAAAIRGLEADIKHRQASGDSEGVKQADAQLKVTREDRDLLEVFKKDVNSYSRFYEFISQVADLESPDLEKMNLFCRGLYPHLRTEKDETRIDLSEIEMTHYRLRLLAQQRIDWDKAEVNEGLEPIQPGTAKPKDPAHAFLIELLEKLNDLFTDEKLSEGDRLNYAKTIADKVCENGAVMAQVNANDRDQILRGDFHEAVSGAVMAGFDAHSEMAGQVLSNDKVLRSFAALVLDLIKMRGA